MFDRTEVRFGAVATANFSRVAISAGHDNTVVVRFVLTLTDQPTCSPKSSPRSVAISVTAAPV
jgi:hypothetical protein